MMDEEAAEQVKALVARGVLGPGAFGTDDCRTTFAKLSERGVNFLSEPTERFYGIDCGLRDPFGNHIRFSQPTATP